MRNPCNILSYMALYSKKVANFDSLFAETLDSLPVSEGDGDGLWNGG